MHKEQKDFCEQIKARYPQYFKNKNVLDVGSLDINGNNRYLFTNCQYTGLDVGAGSNVDIITPIHKYEPGFKYDVIISTEMLEHDRYLHVSLKHMFKLLKPGGIIILTAATVGRNEHGTHQHEPESSPYTNDYYKAVKPDDILISLIWQEFNVYELSIDTRTIADIRFFGIKK